LLCQRRNAVFSSVQMDGWGLETSRNVMPEQSDPYVLGGTQTEQQRLVAQASEFEMQARWLLDQIDIRPGEKRMGRGSP